MTNPAPNYPVTTAYGVKGNWAAGYHTGEDRACPSGTRVVAAASGQVVAAGWEGDYGNAVTIATGGVRHKYCHLSNITCWIGQDVLEGQQIGNAGSTGNSTGPHLHYEERTSPFDYGSDRKPQFPYSSQQPQPQPPSEEEDYMAGSPIVFFNYNNATYEANILAGTYYWVKNPQDLKDRQHVLTAKGIPWSSWEDGATVANPEAFGRLVE